MTRSGGASFSYHTNGNLTQDSASCSTTGTHCYTYDAEGEGRVASATATAGGTWTYRYDPFGRRIAKIAPSGTTTLYLPDLAGNEVGEYDKTSGNVLKENAFDPHMAAPVAWLGFTSGANPVVSFDHVDRLGSVVATSSAGSIVNQYSYMPWGESAALSSGFGYAGYRYDAETGLYYVRARYYDPRLGRFLEPDPLGQAPGLNIYAYTGGDPLNLTDPLGLCAGIGCGVVNTAYNLIQAVNPIGSAQAAELTPQQKIAAELGEETDMQAEAGGQGIAPFGGSAQAAPPVPGLGGIPAASLPADDSQLSHIFRDAVGHLTNTSENQQTLLDLTNNAGNLLGTDQFGNHWFAQVLPDGTQVWGSVRNGIIQNGGLNSTPRTFNPNTGLSR
jgi:RHS repeat-associated protein